MRHLDQRCDSVKNPLAFLHLDFEARQRVRSRVVASNGEVIGLHIARGTSLRDGDCLCGKDGAVFMVRAAGEMLSVIRSTDPVDLTRAAYHLGNRHVRLQIESDHLSYQADHVLDDMIVQLGFAVERAILPFEPEPGAYHRHGERGTAPHRAHGHDHLPSEPHHHLTEPHHHASDAHHHHDHETHSHHLPHLSEGTWERVSFVEHKSGEHRHLITRK